MNWIQKGIADVFNIPYGGLIDVERNYDSIYGVDYNLFDIQPDFGFECISDLSKIKLIFSNPAVLRVFRLQCDLFSLAKFYVYENGKAVKSDKFLDWVKAPNAFQSRKDLLWTYMFYKMLGGAYGYTNSKILSNTTKLFWLDPSKITFPIEFEKYKDRIVLSKEMENSINRMDIKYRYAAGDESSFAWGDIMFIPDLSNGTGNWFRSHSMLDSLLGIISNSKAAIESKNINTRYAGKFMVAGKTDQNDVTKLPMGQTEKEDIETKMNGTKTIHAVKSMIDIQRFVQNANILGELDSSYHSDLYKIGAAYGIPKDVLEAAEKGSTYENQSESRGAHVSYTLAPAGESLTDSLSVRFGYNAGREIVLSWDHLSFMQVFEQKRASLNKTKADTLIVLMKAGVKLEEINSILDTEFSILDYEAAQRSTANERSTGTSQGQNAQ